jgi:site-specific DNA-methyltransferase (adenine-specific)
MVCKIENIDCKTFLNTYSEQEFDLTFLDPPFNQDKVYRNHNDNMSQDDYWNWMKLVCKLIYEKSSQGAAMYFMQREKNTANVMETLESTGWTFQNLIIWKKKSSAVPMSYRFGKQYQIIAFYTKGSKPRIFNRIRNDPPLLVTEKYSRPSGLYVTDVWDDIREMTSGYFAGDEPLRDEQGNRFHKQQSPIHLLLRIILSSTNVDDLVFDPFAGTGTTLITAKQLNRASLGLEIDRVNVSYITKRLNKIRDCDNINQYRDYYRFTKDLNSIWPKYLVFSNNKPTIQPKLLD